MIDVLYKRLTQRAVMLIFGLFLMLHMNMEAERYSVIFLNLLHIVEHTQSIKTMMLC